MADSFKPSEAPTQTESTYANVGNTVNLLPKLLAAINNGGSSGGQSRFDAISQFMTQYQDLANRGMESGTVSDSNRVNSDSGRSLVTGLQGLEDLINPEFATDRTLANSKARDLVNSYDLNGLSGGESAAIERANSMSNFFKGNGSTPNATTTTENAMNFGKGYDEKRTNLSNAIANLNTTANAYKSGINPQTAIFGNDATKANITANAATSANKPFDDASNTANALLGVGSAANSSRNQFLSSDASIQGSTSGGINAGLSSY